MTKVLLSSLLAFSNFTHTILVGLLLLGCIQAETSSEGQNQAVHPPRTITSETVDTVTLYGPNDMVRNVKSAKNGDILFAASFSGVFRYNGKTFTNIASKIGSRRYWDVLEDRKGDLWFATTDSGVYRYKGNSFQHFTTKEGLVDNRVMKVYEDKAGIIWLGTGGGVSRYDGKSFRNFTTKDGLSHNDITTIMEDKTGKLWFGTRGDACFYDEKTFTVFKNKDGKPFHNVWSIIEDQKGNIWFNGSIIKKREKISDKGTNLIVEMGIWRYDGSTFIKATDKEVYNIMEDNKGNIWTTGKKDPFNTRGWVLSRYDEKSLYDEKPTFTEIMPAYEGAMLCGILEANDGSIWFGGMGSTCGVFRYDGKTITDFKKKEDSE